ncbi:hypothetical protein ACB098_12G068100 [Castanea mollissima]
MAFLLIYLYAMVETTNTTPFLIFCLLTHTTSFFFFSFFFRFFSATFPSPFAFFISPFSQFSSTNFFQYLSLTLFQILLALTQYPHFNKVTSVSHSSSRIKTHFSTTL